LPEINIKYDAIPTISAFHASQDDIRCIVGPVGSGKTSGAALEVLFYIPEFLSRYYKIKKTRWVVLRNSYRELADSTQKTVMEWFPWGTLKKADQIFTLKWPKNFANRWMRGIEIEVLFRSCDRPEDVKKFKSLEVTGYWIDESIEVKEEIKRMLKNRIGRYPKMCPVRYGIETTNPPDIEHSTYTDFNWTTPPPGPVPTGRPLEGHTGFWQPPNENADNLRAGYYTDLIRDYAGNPDWIDRYVRGKPGVTIQGKEVFNNFKKEFHVAKEPLIWSKGNLFAGWDNTGNCPACVIVQVPTAGMIQVLAEYHTERMGIVDFVQMVVLDRNLRWPNAEWTEWGDPAGEAKFSRQGGGLTSNADLMHEAVGINLLRSEQNWEARREAVETQLGRIVGGEPALLIDPSCVRLINGFLGGYSYAEIGSTGIYNKYPIKNKYSHVMDALQYILVMLIRYVSKERTRKGAFTGFKNFQAIQQKQYESDYREVYVR